MSSNRKQGTTAGIKIAMKVRDDKASKHLNKQLADEDNSGKTPLHYAAEMGNVEVVRLITKENVDLDAGDKNGNTPAMLAAQSTKLTNRQKVEVINALLLNGMDPLKTNHKIENVLLMVFNLCDQYAKTTEDYDILRKLATHMKRVIIRLHSDGTACYSFTKNGLPIFYTRDDNDNDDDESYASDEGYDSDKRYESDEADESDVVECCILDENGQCPRCNGTESQRACPPPRPLCPPPQLPPPPPDYPPPSLTRR